MWTIENSKGYEARKVKNRITEYLHGTILDFGCGNEKICNKAKPKLNNLNFSVFKKRIS